MKFLAIPNVVELCPEVRQVFDVLEGLGIRPVDLQKLSGTMKPYFGFGRLELKWRVPGSAIRAIEPTARRVGVGKCRIHDMRVRNPKHQLVDADARQQSRFPKYTIVSRAFQFAKPTEFAVILGQS